MRLGGKKQLAIVCAVIGIAVAAGCSRPSSEDANKTKAKTEAGTSQTYVWKAGHNLSTEHPYHLGLVKFGELMAQKSNGKIKLDVFPSTQLGNERDVIEALQMGTADVTLVSTAPLSGFSNEFLVFDLPYILKDRDHAYKVLDGPIGQRIMATLEKNKLIGLAFMENGFYSITSSKQITHPSDMKGVKIRSLENPLQVDSYNFIGANACPMAFGEVFTALQNKTLDATALTYSVIGSQKIYTVQKYLADTWHFYAPRKPPHKPKDLEFTAPGFAGRGQGIGQGSHGVPEEDVRRSGPKNGGPDEGRRKCIHIGRSRRVGEGHGPAGIRKVHSQQDKRGDGEADPGNQIARRTYWPHVGCTQ